MKQQLLFILIAVCILFSSCEDNPTDALVPVQNHFLTATINGNIVRFERTKVVKETVTENGQLYTDLVVTANKNNDTSTQIIFRLEYLQPAQKAVIISYTKPAILNTILKPIILSQLM